MINGSLLNTNLFLTTMFHDATSGLHDIKAIPTFLISSNFLDVILLLLALSAVAGAVFWIYKRQKKLKPTELSSLETLQVKLRALEQEFANDTISFSHLSSEISLCLRTFLAENFKYLAQDKTTLEFEREFLTIMQSALDKVSTKKLESAFSQCLIFLKQCEELSFGTRLSGISASPSSDANSQKSDLKHLFRDCEKLAGLYQSLLDEQRQNSISVISGATRL